MQPPKDFDYYVDRAKIMHGWYSDSQVAKALGLSRSSVHHYRKGSKLPGDEIVAKLAMFAGEPIPVALIDLQLWRSQPDGTAWQAYLSIRSNLTRTSEIAA